MLRNWVWLFHLKTRRTIFFPLNNIFPFEEKRLQNKIWEKVKWFGTFQPDYIQFRYWWRVSPFVFSDHQVKLLSAIYKLHSMKLLQNGFQIGFWLWKFNWMSPVDAAHQSVLPYSGTIFRGNHNWFIVLFICCCFVLCATYSTGKFQEMPFL